jgi:hypothetical protein
VSGLRPFQLRVRFGRQVQLSEGLRLRPTAALGAPGAAAAGSGGGPFPRAPASFGNEILAMEADRY